MKKIAEENMEFSTYFIAAVGALGSLLAIGTFFYHFLEKWTWIQAFYFSVVTLATVGYGDLYPTNDFSRLFTAIYILFGVSISVAAITFIGSRYLSKREEKILRKREMKAEEKLEKSKIE